MDDETEMNESQAKVEGPDEADADLLNGDESRTVLCPSCKGEIEEDADRCPLCGQSVVRNAGIPWWVFVLAVLAAFGLVVWLMR